MEFTNTHIEEKQHLSLTSTTYTNTSNNTPSYTHVILYTIRRVHPAKGVLGHETMPEEKQQHHHVRRS